MSEDGASIVPGPAGSPPAPGGGGGQVQADRAAALAAYFETNRGRYTEEALRRAASSAGYTDAEIEAAWSADPAVTAIDGARPRARLRIAIPVAILYVVGLYLASSLLGSSAQYDLTLPAFLVAGAAGIVGWAVMRNTRPSLALGLGLGVILAVVLPIVLFLVLLGMCIVSGGGTPIVIGG
jgi:hypothetical protein